jgi:fibronectin-binding autotransporter adhesin
MSQFVNRVPRARSIRRIIAAAALAAPVIGLGAQVHAATLFWSGNGTVQGGVGTWNTTGQNWGTVAAGPYTTVWNNANVDSAVLDSTPGAITTGSAITVNTITANTSTTSSASSWLIGNSTTAATNQITFSGANSGINANYSSGTIFLRNAAKGELTKTGAGRLELDNTAMAITKYTLQAGAISIPAVSRLGAAPGALDQDFFVFDGGGFAAAVATADLGTTRGVTIEDGGAFFGGSAATNLITVGAPIVGTAGGSLNVTAAGPFYSPLAAGAIVLLTNTANSWNGATNVSAGGLRLGASGVIPDGSAVTLTGTSTLDLNSFSETVGTVVVNGSGVQIIPTSGTPTLTGASYDLRQSNITANQGISAVLGGTGVNATKTTSNTVLFSAKNTYTGTTTISAGILSIDGDATLGSGTGTLILNGGRLNSTANRTVSTDPVANPISLTASSTITTTSAAATVNLNLSSNSVGGSAGTLTFRNEGNATTGQFAPRFSGTGFTFSQPIVIDNGTTGGTTQLSSFNTTGTQTFSGDISGNGSYNRSSGSTGGTTLFTGNNTYTGATTVNNGTLTAAGVSTNKALGATSQVVINSAGILQLGSSDQINDVAAIMLNGGTFDTGGFDEGTVGTNGLGLLTQNSITNSIIDMSLLGDSIIRFADSSGIIWAAGTLSIHNWSGTPVIGGGLDQLHFGGTPGSLTLDQLAKVNFYSDAGITLLGGGGAEFADQSSGVTGEIVPVPEPTSAMLLALGGLGLIARRRRNA